jgi:hypothetical protein
MNHFAVQGAAAPVGRIPVSWAAELVELAAVFMAVGLAHLFVSLVGHHADGATMLVISGQVTATGVVGEGF